MSLNFNPFKSMTFWGAVVVLSAPLIQSALTHQPITAEQWQTFVGGILAALGLRNAVGGPTAASK